MTATSATTPRTTTALHLRGAVLPEGVERDLYVVDGHITFRQPDEATTILDGGWIIPGLADAHAHLALASPAPPEATPEERVRASARAQLEAGALLIREPGSPNYASRGLGPDQGLPRIITAGHLLAPPNSYFPGLAREVLDEDLPAVAEQEARASGAWAKVIGDFVGPDGRMKTNYRSGTLIEAARRVHAVGGRIAIHATTAAAIEMAIEAGFDSIEHGWGLQDDHIVEMARRGIALVPTLTILPTDDSLFIRLGLRPEVCDAMWAVARRHPEMAWRAARAGVLVLAGTDAGMVPHGLVRQEIQNLVDAGLPSESALAAGSWAARRFLGLPGLEEGAHADLIAYPNDPRNDPRVLYEPSLCLLDGRRVNSEQ